MCLLEELQASRKLQESSGSGSGSCRSHDVESPSAAAAAAESASSVATENPLPEPEPVVADLLELSITEDPPATAQTTALSTELSADANHASSKEADFSLASLDGASSQGMQSYSSAQDQAAHAETEGYGEVGSEGVFDLYADMEMHIQHAHEDIAVGTSSPTASAAGTLVELFASSPISMKEPASPVTVDVAITATTPVAITAATPGPTSAAKNGADEPEESDNARLIIGEDIEIEEGNDGHESSSSKSGAGVDTPMPDFKSPALRSPIHIHLDQAERDRNRNGHKNGNGDGNGGVALNMGLELEMERLVLSVNEDLHLYGHEGAGGTGGREEEGLEKLGDLSEESLAYLSQQEASASASASASAAGAVAKEEAEEERDSGSLRWEEP